MRSAADGSCGALVGMAYEKKVAPHWRPAFPEDPCQRWGRLGTCIAPPSLAVTAQTMVPLSSLHLLSVERELLFLGFVTILLCHSSNKASGAWRVAATL